MERFCTWGTESLNQVFLYSVIPIIRLCIFLAIYTMLPVALAFLILAAGSPQKNTSAGLGAVGWVFPIT